MTSRESSDRHGIPRGRVHAERRLGRVVAMVAAMAVAVGLSTGCAARSGLMSRTTESPSALQPAPGKALVVFLRPAYLGYAIQAVVYDGVEFVGVVSRFSAVPYLAEPGPHRFMVVSEAADFLEAELAADRTYFVEVAPRMGVWRARFSLNPLPVGIFSREIGAWLAESKVVRPNPAGLQWAERNRSSVMRKKAAGESEWLRKGSRPRLAPEDGLVVTPSAN